MAPSDSDEEKGHRALWLFRDLVAGESADEALSALCGEGRMERWGHAAQIPLWPEANEIYFVIAGGVLVQRASLGDLVRLDRGDAFGNTLQKKPSLAVEERDRVVAHQEATICAIDRRRFQEISDALFAERRVEAGRWPRKEQVHVSVWPLLGTLPTVRLARVVLFLVENYGEIDGNKARLPVLLRVRQLAELGGMSRRRAEQVWRLFATTNLISVEGRSLIIADLKELRRLATG